MIFKTRAILQGGHFHVRVFSAKSPEHTFAKLGSLIMDSRDYESFTAAFEAEHVLDPDPFEIPPSFEAQ